ncbi:protein-L-isoaspartate(D-aspartate) O-methyltransferase [Helicobacter muridarum]|uniref:Protein-L-isoaspartate O-methyltransferase n=1 Tax=Helicobacter muridarum TaxID=216 RepID=A0A099TXL8_9HELI|nr:protein-L-isoaspartate(D-aspartate) O-methyltransferase [Helicobacter muridarum]TLE00864.1 protein-L-isoaspartate(D-aspartate) O-methyltransferase [Helicobacter muridarum]STQ86636.1 protein-L-isoaspartate O-methyltransferase [Helicobacter muridarum]
MQPHSYHIIKLLKGLPQHIDSTIIDAIAKTNRELFVNSTMKDYAFENHALPMNDGQWISSPSTVAKMSSYLLGYDISDLSSQKPDNVLEIGLGSGYQAVVLSHLFRRVFSIERIESLLFEARSRIASLQIQNITTMYADGMKGWIDHSPYDRILLSACASEIPTSLIDQLSNNAILVAPIYHDNKQVIMRLIKKNGMIVKQEILEQCQFVPIQDGIVKGGGK